MLIFFSFYSNIKMRGKYEWNLIWSVKLEVKARILLLILIETMHKCCSDLIQESLMPAIFLDYIRYEQKCLISAACLSNVLDKYDKVYVQDSQTQSTGFFLLISDSTRAKEKQWADKNLNKLFRKHSIIVCLHVPHLQHFGILVSALFRNVDCIIALIMLCSAQQPL